MVDAYETNTLVFDPSLCNGCAMCTTVCPHQVFEMHKKRARMVNPRRCMECGACQMNCSTGAIRVDSGVGCAYAMMQASLLGQKEASCECG